MSEQLYKQANPNGAQGFDPNNFTQGAAGATEENTGADANSDGTVYDADYKVEDEDNK